MKKSKEQNFERKLPDGYRQALYINAKDTKLGIILNLVAFAVLAVVMGLAVLSLHLGGRLSADIFEIEGGALIVAYLVFFASMLGYIVLHELVHGAAYKLLTGERLTFGVSWSCAFCGVPHVFTHRKTAIISVAAPLVAFSIIFIPILVLIYLCSPLYYLMVAFVFGLHLGGCSGDIYLLYLLAMKFRGHKVLMRDTGPEQFFYVPDHEE